MRRRCVVEEPALSEAEGTPVTLAASQEYQGILAMLPTVREELPETAEELRAVQGSFDFETASLREVVSSLRMTERECHNNE